MLTIHQLQITIDPAITLPHTADGSMTLQGNYIAEPDVTDGIYKIWDADGDWKVINPANWKRVGINVSISGQAIIS